ncbi:MAG: hypothetical protein JWO82_2421 [Akkermansiaceae bacterium]|nr:hypothetical protein [Akkermansiaceae bacterium]
MTMMKTKTFSARFFSLLVPLLGAVLLLPQASRAQLTQRPQVGAYFDGVLPKVAPAVATDWSTVVAFPNLSFQNPVGLAPLPGTNQLVVWEREGRVWAFENDPAVAVKTLLLDLSKNCQGWDDSGLLGLAFHPDFVNNRQVFAWYNWKGGQAGVTGELGPIQGDPSTRPPAFTANRNRLARFVVAETPEATLASEYVLMDESCGTLWHNGGEMFFHPQNGFLYLSNGDDQNNAGKVQTVTALFSCVMRLDVDKRGGSISHAPSRKSSSERAPEWPRYYVPNDRGFPAPGQSPSQVLEEIYAIGLRNPCKMSLDPLTGRIFIGDVGADTWEEINVIEPGDPQGLNFQWNTIEGAGADLTGTYPGVSKRPVLAYLHGTDDGSCVIGGRVYRGAAFPELTGKYIFGDNMSGRIWYLDESVTPARKVLLAQLPDGPGPNSGNDYRGLSGFGNDAAGELYLCQMSSTDGKIHRLQRGGPAPSVALPATLSATGFFSDMANLTPSARLLPYEVNAPFWSDGAVKTRYVAIPSGKTVGFTPQGEWDFPAGSVFVKHFDLPVSEVNPALKRRVETRFIAKKEDGTVYGATYRWRDDQSDADLLGGPLTESIPVETAGLGSFTGMDLGNATAPGTTVREGHALTLTTGTPGVVTASADICHFGQQTRSGDFDVAVRVTQLTQPAGTVTQAGLMVRESLEAGSRDVVALVPSSNPTQASAAAYALASRREADGFAATVTPVAAVRVAYPNTWLRLQRQGNVFIASASQDGASWSEYARTTLELPQQVYFGPFVRGYTGTTVAKFEVESRRQRWTYPGRENCVTCHNPQSGGVLGVSTRQLNRTTSYHGGPVENQIRAWAHAGMFHDAPADTAIPGLEKLAAVTDTAAGLELRARSYLDANCASCHRPGGVQALWDARFQTPFAQQGIKYGEVANHLGLPDSRVVVPGDLPDSLLHARVNRVGVNQMPPFGRNTIDTAGVALLADWIGGLSKESVVAPALTGAAGGSHTRIDLSWQDNSANETGFAIERSADGGVTFTRIGTVAAGVTTFSDAAVEPFTQQTYRVAAFNDYVNSAWSNGLAAVSDAGPAASRIRITAEGDGQVIRNGDYVPGDAAGTDFGVVRAGQAGVRRFVLKNAGNAPLTLTGAPRVSLGGPDAGAFAIAVQPPQATLAGGAGVMFEVVFTPDDDGRKSALVTILSDDAGEPETTFAITAEGISAALAGWWKFDETSGAVAADSSGNGMNMTMRTPLPGWVPGLLGGALNFTGEPTQAVYVSDRPQLNFPNGLTMACWMNADDWAMGHVPLYLSSGGTVYWFRAQNGILNFRVGSGLATAPLPPPHQWFHLALTYDGATMAIYLDGQLAGSAAYAMTPFSTTGYLYVGSSALGSYEASIPGYHFFGRMDDLRVYGKALSAAQIASIGGRASTLQIAAGPEIAQKGTGKSGSLILTRSGATAADLPVSLAALGGAGHAQAGVDFALAAGPSGLVIPAGQTVATVAVNPLTRPEVTGTLSATLQVQASPAYQLGAQVAATVTILDSPYNLWKIGAFGGLAGAQGTAAADDADADSDGLSTFMEAALGGNPLVSDSAGRLPKPQVEMVDGGLYLTLSYTRPKAGAAGGVAGLSYAGRTTADLALLNGWQDAVMAGGFPHDNGDGTETVKMRSALPVGAAPRQFMRLEVSRP